MNKQPIQSSAAKPVPGKAIEPHPLEPYRDRIEALRNAVDQLISDVEDLAVDINGVHIPGVGMDGREDARYSTSGRAYTCYTLGGLEQAQETLQNCVTAMDEWEPAEAEPVEDDDDEAEPEDDENDDEGEGDDDDDN